MPVILVWCKNNKKVSFCGFVQKGSRNNVSLTLRELAERRQLAYDLIIVLSTLCFLHMPPLAIKYIMIHVMIDVDYIMRHVKKRLQYPAPSSLSCCYFSSFFNSHLLHTHTHQRHLMIFLPPSACPHAQEPPQRNPWGHWAFLHHLRVAFFFRCHCRSPEYLASARCDDAHAGARGGGGGGGGRDR